MSHPPKGVIIWNPPPFSRFSPLPKSSSAAPAIPGPPADGTLGSQLIESGDDMVRILVWNVTDDADGTVRDFSSIFKSFLCVYSL